MGCDNLKLHNLGLKAVHYEVNHLGSYILCHKGIESDVSAVDKCCDNNDYAVKAQQDFADIHLRQPFLLNKFRYRFGSAETVSSPENESVADAAENAAENRCQNEIFLLQKTQVKAFKYKKNARVKKCNHENLFSLFKPQG